jgi:predicted phosphodiesterase
MRVLVVSDIHANWPALRAICEDADVVVCLGDIVSYGPFPAECLAWVRAHAAHVVRGNHDTALALGVEPGAASFKRELARLTLESHRTLLDKTDLEWLGTRPTECRFRCGDYRLYATHASPSDHLYSYRMTPDFPESDLRREVEGIRADLVLLGHTHLPMCRGAWTTVVLNPGSVGQPLDGDARASYAIIQDGIAEIRRVSYDVESAVAGIRHLRLPREAADALIVMLRTGRPAARSAGTSCGMVG